MTLQTCLKPPLLSTLQDTCKVEFMDDDTGGGPDVGPGGVGSPVGLLLALTQAE